MSEGRREEKGGEKERKTRGKEELKEAAKR